MINEIINSYWRFRGKYYYSEGEELPDDVGKKEIFIGGKLKNNWVVVMRCPCGCGDKIYLNTLRSERPYWKIIYKRKGVSISPSIWRTRNCKSHFFVTNGKIIWAYSSEY
jgi:hypothetical protein